MRAGRAILVVACGLFAAISAFFYNKDIPRQSGAMPQQAYLWQRVWSEPVLAAVKQSAPEFEQFTILAAEISWAKGQPKVTRTEPGWATLRETKKALGLALRIGPYSGPFSKDGTVTEEICRVALSIVEEARAHEIKPAELQVDFDCAESKLHGYHIWLTELRRCLKPVRLTITALPSWLDRQEFSDLVRSTDGFVLQVHALTRPKNSNEEIQLCNPIAARQAVEIASRTDVPFMVALPTYSYLTAFNLEGRFIGASAEGPESDWPPNILTKELNAEPESMASLVRQWTTNRPASLRGIVWYRLPVATDKWNWNWPTLAHVMRGHAPKPNWQVSTRSPERGLIEVLLMNASDATGVPQPTVRLDWQQSRLIASDSLSGNDLEELSATAAEFRPSNRARAIQPGESRALGWMRFNTNVDVRCEVVAP
jgi:hypothetical protein